MENEVNKIKVHQVFNYLIETLEDICHTDEVKYQNVLCLLEKAELTVLDILND